MEQSNYFYSHEPKKMHEYIKSHKFTIDEYDYIIENEIADIKYYNDYVYIMMIGLGGQYEYFIPYRSISCACLIQTNSASRCSNLNVIEYNKIQYELNKGD